MALKIYDWNLNLDMHNHILPGIDDGAKNVAASIPLLHGLAELGFKKTICTPQIGAYLYDNDRHKILKSFKQLLDAHDPVIGMIQGLAAEYTLDENFEELLSKGLIILDPMGKSNLVLLTISYLGLPKNYQALFYKLKTKGYQPIIAHPERCHFMDPALMIESFKGLGVYFQLSILSLGGYYGESAKINAQYFLKEKFYQFAGTDVHHIFHIEALKKIKTDPVISEILYDYPFMNNLVLHKEQGLATCR